MVSQDHRVWRMADVLLVSAITVIEGLLANHVNERWCMDACLESNWIRYDQDVLEKLYQTKVLEG